MLYRSRPIKRARRTKADLETIREAIYNVISENKPMTVRQLFYQLVTSSTISKTETSYKNIVVRLLGLHAVMVTCHFPGLPTTPDG